MAEITVDIYGKDTYVHSTPPTITFKKTNTKLSISPRGGGFEYKLITNGSLMLNIYSSRKVVFGIFHDTDSPLYSSVFFDNLGDFPFPLSFTGGKNGNFMFKKDDAMRLYDFFADLNEWSPDALASGTAHPDLMAAQQRHSAAATPGLINNKMLFRLSRSTDGGGGGGGGGSRKTRKRKSRK